MDFLGLYKESIKRDLELRGLKFNDKRIYSFIDFGNVNYWYKKDIKDSDNKVIPKDKRIVVGIEKLSEFVKAFSIHQRFYYGIDTQDKKSWKITFLAKKYFKTITKPIQKIKHYLEEKDSQSLFKNSSYDVARKYIYIRKCNFDVEICLDAIRLIDEYDVFCLFSGDADFSCLADYLKKRGKKIVLFSSGYVSHLLKEKADVNINAQDIKKYITFIK